MAGDYLEVGDVVKDSSTGPGTITDITDAGYPQVNHIAVAWLAGAVPLTDAQIAEMMRDTWGRASIAPRHALEFARAVERAHGIKGGQHG